MSTESSNQITQSQQEISTMTEEYKKCRQEFQKHRSMTKCYSCCILISLILGLTIWGLIGLAFAFNHPMFDGNSKLKHMRIDNKNMLDNIHPPTYSQSYEKVYHPPKYSLPEKLNKNLYNKEVIISHKPDQDSIKFHKNILEIINRPHRVLRVYNNYNKHHKNHPDDDIILLMITLFLFYAILWLINGILGYNASTQMNIKAARKFKVLNTILVSFEIIKFVISASIEVGNSIAESFENDIINFNDDDIIGMMIGIIITILFTVQLSQAFTIPINYHRSLLTFTNKYGTKNLKQHINNVNIINPNQQQVSTRNNNVLYNPANKQQYPQYPVYYPQQPIKYQMPQNTISYPITSYNHQGIIVPNKTFNENLNNQPENMFNKYPSTYSNIQPQQAPYFNKNYQPVIGLRESSTVDKNAEIFSNQSQIIQNYTAPYNTNMNRNIMNQNNPFNTNLGDNRNIMNQNNPFSNNLVDNRQFNNQILESSNRNSFTVPFQQNRNNSQQPPTEVLNNLNNLYPDVGSVNKEKF